VSFAAGFHQHFAAAFRIGAMPAIRRFHQHGRSPLYHRLVFSRKGLPDKAKWKLTIPIGKYRSQAKSSLPSGWKGRCRRDQVRGLTIAVRSSFPASLSLCAGIDAR
jgi:hypothetical protein